MSAALSAIVLERDWDALVSEALAVELLLWR
jgi:hypothetical protein